MDNPILFKIVRRTKQRIPVGCVLARKLTETTYGVGWSKVNLSHGDKFDKQRAIDIAWGRAERFNDTVPNSILEAYKRMCKRAEGYYKGMTCGTRITYKLKIDESESYKQISREQEEKRSLVQQMENFDQQPVYCDDGLALAAP